MESSPRAWRLSKPLVLLTLAVTIAHLPITASAACSDSKVKRLSRQGKTVATIARTCDMDAGDVRDILEEEDQEESASSPSRPQGPVPNTAARQSNGLSPGTPLAPCGCWGAVAPGYREPNPACGSGYAVPRMCPQVCPAGGYAWQGVCG